VEAAPVDVSLNRLFVPLTLVLMTIGFMACGSGIDPVGERQKLLDTDIEFSKASKEVGAAEAFFRFMTEEGKMLPASGPPVVGRATIRERMSDGDYTIDWEPAEAEVAASGDLGYTWGNYITTINSPSGEVTKITGRYLNIWKKQPDGSWRVAIDMGNKAEEQADKQ
jgi:ketosteroid isomerase-like protein